jgi:hypothetical protein
LTVGFFAVVVRLAVDEDWPATLGGAPILTRPTSTKEAIQKNGFLFTMAAPALKESRNRYLQ